MHTAKLRTAAVLSALALVGVAPLSGAVPASGAALAHEAQARAQVSGGLSTSPYPSLASCRAAVKDETYSKGVLTVATDDPAYSPWFVSNTPSNGKGYESAVAYEVGSLLGFDHKDLKWVTEPFDSSYAPGPKAFDFDINEISVTPDRAKVVTFSISYYDTTQSIVALKSDPIVEQHSPTRAKDLPLRRPDRHDRARLHLRQDPPVANAPYLQHLGRGRGRASDKAGRRHRRRHAGRPVHGLFGGKKRRCRWGSSRAPGSIMACCSARVTRSRPVSTRR